MPVRMALALTLLFPTLAARADDWPQWMGPHRDNTWREDGALDRFPAGGPKVVWRAPVAGGYAGPAVAGGRVFVTDYTTRDVLPEGNFDRKPTTGTESVRCLDAATGKEIWHHDYPVRYAISYPAGPRCTPLVHAGKVYALGAEGNLLCLDVESGRVVWAKDLKAEYKTKSALWGYAAHPLIDGRKLITLAGGDGSHVVALDVNTGKEIWRSQTQLEQGYCPPLITEAGGVRQLVVAGPAAVRGLEPETGKRLWTTPYEADNGGVIMTPVRGGDYLFVGGYSNKNLLLKLRPENPGVEVVWRDKKNAAVSPINVQPFYDAGVLYGYDQNGLLYAADLATGKRLWESPGPVGGDPQNSGTGFIVKQGDRYWFFTEKGDLVTGRLSPKGYEEVDRAHVIEPSNVAFGRKVVWCMPAFAGRRMYVRSDRELICVDLAK